MSENHSERRIDSRLSKLDKNEEIKFGDNFKITRETGNMESNEIKANGDVAVGDNFTIDEVTGNLESNEIKANGDLAVGDNFTVDEPTGDVAVNRLTASNLVELAQLAVDPVGAPNGAMYYNTNENEIRIQVNGAWHRMDTTLIV